MEISRPFTAMYFQSQTKKNTLRFYFYLPKDFRKGKQNKFDDER